MTEGNNQILQQVINIYLYRTELSEFFKRPDSKQDLVKKFQKSFNDIPAHLRTEDVMKAELHHRVDVREIYE